MAIASPCKRGIRPNNLNILQKSKGISTDYLREGLKYSPNKQGASKEVSIIKYQNFYLYVVPFGLNRGGTLDKYNNAITHTEWQKINFFGTQDITLVFTDEFDEVHKRVGLILCQIQRDAENLGSTVKGELRVFSLNKAQHQKVPKWGRDSLKILKPKDFMLATDEEPNVFKHLEDWGILSHKSRSYKPWLYAVDKQVSLCVFETFVKDLKNFYIDIGLSGIPCQEYLMRRLDEVYATHNQIMKDSDIKTDMVAHTPITIMEYPDWWNFRHSTKGVLKTFISQKDFIHYYSSQPYCLDSTYLTKQLKLFMATMPYSEDFCATLTLIDAFKHQEYHNGLTSKVKKGLMSVMGLDNTQLVNVLNKYGVTAYRFFDAMLKIKILPTYKGVVYPTLLDMCNSTRLTLKEVLDESNLQKIIKGDTLDFVFK